jgi:hypothetical protein
MLSVLLTRFADVTAVGNAGKQVEPSGSSLNGLGPFLFLAARTPKQISAQSQLAWQKTKKAEPPEGSSAEKQDNTRLAN